MVSISGGYSSIISSQSDSANGLGQSLNALQNAVQSGNLSTAQTAFSSLLNYFPSLSQASDSSTSSSASNGIVNDLESIQTAIQSGNTNAAQNAITKLTSALHSSRGQGGRHRHYSGGSSDVIDAGSQPGSRTTNNSSSSSSTGNTTVNSLQGNSSSSGLTINYLA